jgi:hypothetical protein
MVVNIKSGSAASINSSIGSTANIANITIGGSEVRDEEVRRDLEGLMQRLQNISSPLSVGEIADIFSWSSGRAARVLARGEQSGILELSTDGGTTMVSKR